MSELHTVFKDSRRREVQESSAYGRYPVIYTAKIHVYDADFYGKGSQRYCMGSVSRNSVRVNSFSAPLDHGGTQQFLQAWGFDVSTVQEVTS